MLTLGQQGVIFGNLHGKPHDTPAKGSQLLKTALQLGEVGESIGTTAETMFLWQCHITTLLGCSSEFPKPAQSVIPAYSNIICVTHTTLCTLRS